jgi:predicted MFS family arabinose efflux permease
MGFRRSKVRILSPRPTRIWLTIVPSRLGTNFRWLLSSAVVNNVGDGIGLAAGPLLVASLTRDPFLVSMALLSQWLPMLLFGVIGGVAADRFDRRRMVVVVDLGRAVVLVALVVAIATGTIGVGIVLVALFVLGTAETFADSASSTLIPSLVRHEDLGIANARMQGAFLLTNQLVAPPIGAFLFAVGMALPFAASAAAVGLGAVLISRIVGSIRSERAEMAGVWADMREGIGWLIGHPPMRTLAMTILAFNVTFGAAWAVLVLYARDRLGMGEVGYGLLITATAVGGIIGLVSYGSLERRFRLGNIMRVGLLVETATHLVLAVTTTPAIALLTLVVFGAHGFVWGTTSTVVRQRAVPNELLGRVTGVYRVAIVGGLVIGAPIGGVLAGAWGVTAPFWFGFIGSAVLLAILWREFDHIAHGPIPLGDAAAS